VPTALAVALGGGIGAAGRYGLDRLIERRSFSVFPWSTFTINVTGCLVIGFLIAAVVDRHVGPSWLRVGVVMGVVGGYTTFSTFAQETLDLLEESRPLLALAYAAGSVGLGVAAVVAGLALGRLV
jgi:fluoride exporter